MTSMFKKPALLAALVLTTPAHALAPNFVTPGNWAISDTNTTYQEWDAFTATTNNTPDIGHSTSPTIASTPTVDATAPGFRTSSGNFYAFSGDYGFDASVYNHTTATGVSGYGTHVIIQTSETVNGSTGIYPTTIQITDLAGTAITGGDNADLLRYDIIAEGPVSSPFGTVTLREEIYEFFLPNFIGDFKVSADVIVHASLDQIRIDSAIRASAAEITTIPEPASLALLAIGATAILKRKTA